MRIRSIGVSSQWSEFRVAYRFLGGSYRFMQLAHFWWPQLTHLSADLFWVLHWQHTHVVALAKRMSRLNMVLLSERLL